jgi:hypothetical protein
MGREEFGRHNQETIDHKKKLYAERLTLTEQYSKIDRAIEDASQLLAGNEPAKLRVFDAYHSQQFTITSRLQDIKEALGEG